MCDYFWQRMANDQGDLADIVRAGGWVGASSTAFPASDRQLPSEPMVFPSSSTEDLNSNFGDPFSNLCDPLLSAVTGIEFLNNSKTATGQVKVAIESSDCGGGGGSEGGRGLISHELLTDEEIKKPCNIISRALQISSGGAKPSPLSPVVAGEMMKVGSDPVGCLVDDGGGVQISSTRTLGIKRRKNQAKKVVCIPSPAAASSKPSGEVVPSDLWAWRKYGQKPIKGSPYPRGYYRCSSSKGCSARKQVERSRTDPNMLVITYTSEHNHPWPTQRNALAGSTRSQTPKNGSSTSKSSTHTLQSPTALNEGPKETTRSGAPWVKEEVAEEDKAIDPAADNEFGKLLHQCYKPMISESNHPVDFFTDLAELETDPMNLMFSKELTEAKPQESSGDKALDPFDMFH